MSQCIPDLQLLLKDANAAYHNLMTGQQARVFVDQNGERIEYTAANRQELQTYIQSLNSQITRGGCPAMPNTRPLGFLF